MKYDEYKIIIGTIETEDLNRIKEAYNEFISGLIREFIFANSEQTQAYLIENIGEILHN